MGYMVPKETQKLEVVGVPQKAEWENGVSAFRGNFLHTFDDRGRVSLPAEFRDVLLKRGSDRVVLTNFISQGARCIEGFDSFAWAEFETKLKAKSRFNSKIQRLENFYLSRASECVVDKVGRILVPSYLREYASLEKEVTFTSSIYGFRLWNSRVWGVVFSEAEQALLENPDTFSDVDI
jgi:MraZ protein